MSIILIKKEEKKSIIINNININEQTNSFIFISKKKYIKIQFIYIEIKNHIARNKRLQLYQFIC